MVFGFKDVSDSRLHSQNSGGHKFRVSLGYSRAGEWLSACRASVSISAWIPRTHEKARCVWRQPLIPALEAGMGSSD